jgi:hypothetical protein
MIAMLVTGLLSVGCEGQDMAQADEAGAVTMGTKGNASASGSVDTIRFATGWKTGANAATTARDAYTSAISALGCEPKGVIFFTYFERPGLELSPTETAPDLPREQTAAGTVAALAGDTPNIGCRARPLVNGGTLLTDAVAVLAIGGAQADCAVAKAELPPDRRLEPGKKIADQLQDVEDLRIVISLSESSLSFGAADGVSVEDYIRAILEGTPEGTILFGGNNMGFRPEGQDKNVSGQYYMGRPLEYHAVAMGIGGPIRTFPNHTNEFAASEKTVKVTEAVGKWVVSMDGKPAAEVYRDLRGMKADEEFTRDWQHPVGVVVAPGKVYLRMILDWVSEDGTNHKGEPTNLPPGSLRFVSPIVEGTKVKILSGGDDARAIVDSAKEGFAQRVDDARRAGTEPALALVSNCCARGMRLRTFRKGHDDEVPEAILPALNADVPVFGFYAYGELGPIRGPYQGLSHQYQQHTFVSALLGLEESK